MNKFKKSSLVSLCGLVAACAMPEPSEDAPEVVDGDLETMQTVTWNGFVADAKTPVYVSLGNKIYGKATFTGTGMGPMGVCLLELTSTTCTGNDTINGTTGYTGPCTAHPIGAGGWRYCAAPQNSGQKYCAIRYGSQTAYCAGSPAVGGPVATGTYNTPQIGVSTTQVKKWVSYACFNKCDGVDPSISSYARTTGPCQVPPPPGCSADYCLDYGCDGTIEGTCYKSGIAVFCGPN